MEPATINASVLWERMAAWDEELRGGEARGTTAGDIRYASLLR